MADKLAIRGKGFKNFGSEKIRMGKMVGSNVNTAIARTVSAKNYVAAAVSSATRKVPFLPTRICLSFLNADTRAFSI